MKITAVRCFTLEAPMPKPWRIGNYLLEKGSATIVEIDTDEGIQGIGETIVRLGPGIARSVIDEMLGPCILGCDPLNIEGLWAQMFSLMRLRGHTRGFFMEAIGGVDMALWDLAGKALNLPVHRLMMGCHRTKIPVYASSIFWDTPQRMAEVAAGLVDKGYRAIKVKIGQGVETDTACMETIRETVGPDIKLMVDANGAYSSGEAVRMGRRLEALDVIWFEEPVPADDLDGYRTLSNKLDIPIAAGEAEFSSYGVRTLIETGVRIIQPDVARAGGLTEVRKIAALCRAFNAHYAPHTGASSAVCMAASLQLAAAIDNFFIYEHMVGDNPLAGLLLVDPLPEPRNGYITIPEKPGLGIVLDPQAVKKYRAS